MKSSGAWEQKKAFETNEALFLEVRKEKELLNKDQYVIYLLIIPYSVFSVNHHYDPKGIFLCFLKLINSLSQRFF